MPANLHIFAGASFWPAVIIGLVALALGLFLGRASRRTEASRRSITTDSGTYVDLEVYRDSQKVKARLEQENHVFTEFFLMLPDFIKEMGGHIEREDIPRRLLELVEKIFLPSQALVFLADKNTDSLFLSASKGLPPNSPTRTEIRFGEGKLGWVAQAQTAMDQEDFVREMRSGGTSLDAPAEFRFKVDLCAPMLGNRSRTEGIISVGGLTRHPKYEKRLLTMIADLGAIALLNRRLMSEAENRANSDGLTELFNKRYLKTWLGEQIHKAEVGRYPVSIFVFDLDHFKRCNDTHGHLTGDRVLKETAKVLRKTVHKNTDVAARWGGEEFLVVFPGEPKEKAFRAAERIRLALAAHVFEDEDGQSIGPITLSGGVATFPEDGRHQPQLIGAADAALYQAKQAGRNRIIKAEPKFLSNASEDLPVAEGGRPA